MDARGFKLFCVLSAFSCIAASHPTPNFVVTAPTPEIAKKVGNAAEYYRKTLAVEWLGYELPRWYQPCPIYVKVGQVGAGGATSFSFDRGQVFGWNMNVQGGLDQILESVLPHEVSHTIFACHFRRPLPRWADEGAATLAENESEKLRQKTTVRQILGTSKRIPLRQLMAMREYPSDMRDVLTLYAEGYSLAELLVQQGGKARYLVFLADADKHGWDAAIQSHYGYRGIDGLEKSWHEWVVAGSPDLKSARNEQLASNKARPAVIPVSHKKAEPRLAQQGMIVRGQAPDEDPFVERENRVATVQQLPVQSQRSSELQAPAPRNRDTAEAQHPLPQDLPGNNPGYANIGSEESEAAPPAGTGNEWVTIPPDQIEAMITAQQEARQRAPAQPADREYPASNETFVGNESSVGSESSVRNENGAVATDDGTVGQLETDALEQADVVPAVSSYDRRQSTFDMPTTFPKTTRLPRDNDQSSVAGSQPARRQAPRYSEFPHEPRPSPFR